MGHCPYEQLKDLETVLDEIRALKGVQEVKPGIFYIKRKPFLHFHEKAGERWADARSGASWGPQINIPFNASKKEQTNFLNLVKKCYQKTCQALDVN